MKGSDPKRGRRRVIRYPYDVFEVGQVAATTCRRLRRPATNGGLWTIQWRNYIVWRNTRDEWRWGHMSGAVSHLSGAAWASHVNAKLLKTHVSVRRLYPSTCSYFSVNVPNCAGIKIPLFYVLRIDQASHALWSVKSAERAKTGMRKIIEMLWKRFETFNRQIIDACLVKKAAKSVDCSLVLYTNAHNNLNNTVENFPVIFTGRNVYAIITLWGWVSHCDDC